MNEVEKIFSYLSNSDKILVFTSETAARNALTAFIERNPGKAIFRDRAISWDRFLLSLLDTEGKREVTKTERKLFAYSFLKKNGLGSLMHYACESYPESTLSYASSIATILPFFPSRDDAIRFEIPHNMLHDADLLRESYTRYLSENSLYERNYLKPDYSKIEKGRFVFVFPETFTSNLAGKIILSVGIETIPSPSSSETPLIEYENSISEIRSVMRAIEKDREQYPDYAIAITSSSLSTYRPYLESEATKRDIPLVFTSSRPLSDYPEGRFIKELYETYSSNWAFEDTKKLLLNPLYPFKDRESYINIMRKAVDGRMEDKGIRSWMSVLDGEEKNLFLELYDKTSQIMKSRKGRETLQYIKEFRDRFFTPGEWDEENDRVFGSILELLITIGDEGTDDIFRLFVSLVGETQYVERTENEKGIRVYAYPASAGLITGVHYIIGLDDRTTEKKIDDYPFLLKSEKKEEKDITGALLGVYSSPVFTKKTVISGTASGFDGARLLPPVFLERTVKSNEETDDLFKDERNLWINGMNPLLKPYKSQSISFLRAEKTSLKGRKNKVILNSFTDEEISLSVSKIKDYDQCPYRGYVSSRLSLKEKDYSPVMEDPRAVGEILHSTVEKAIEEAGSIGNIDEERLEQLFIGFLIEAERKRKITTHYTFTHIRGKYRDKLASILTSSKAQIYSSLTFKENEKGIENYPLTGKITVNGRIDTILTDEDGNTYIIDWKTGGSSDYSPSSLEDTSLQVILYALLLGDDVRGGAFYSFRDENYKVVWPTETYYQKNGIKKEEGYTKEAVLINSKERLERIKEILECGNYTPKSREKNCLNCPYMRLCRAKFIASTINNPQVKTWGSR